MPDQDHATETDDDLEAVLSAVTGSGWSTSAWDSMPEADVLSSIAAGASPTELEAIVNVGNATYNRQIALHPLTPAGVLTQIADTEPNLHVLAGVTQHMNTPADVKERIKAIPGVDLLASRPKVRRQTARETEDPAVLGILSADGDSEVQQHIARNANSPAAALRHAADTSAVAAVLVHSNPARTAELVNDLAVNGKHRVFAAFDPLTEDVNRTLDADGRIEMMKIDLVVNLQGKVLSTNAWSPVAWTLFAHDPDPQVRAAVAKVPFEVLGEAAYKIIAGDPDPAVQAALTKHHAERPDFIAGDSHAH